MLRAPRQFALRGELESREVPGAPGCAGCRYMYLRQRRTPLNSCRLHHCQSKIFPASFEPVESPQQLQRSVYTRFVSLCAFTTAAVKGPAKLKKHPGQQISFPPPHSIFFFFFFFFFGLGMYLILFGGLENCGKKERKLNLKYYILGFFCCCFPSFL